MGRRGATHDECNGGYSRVVNGEFNWWLLIVGLVVGAGLVWLVVSDSRRREVDEAEAEREGEALWIGEAMRDAGRGVADRDVLDILRLHAAYLAASPPDDVWDDAGTAEAETSDAGAADADRRWVPVPDPRPAGITADEHRPMANPIRPERPDQEGGQA